MKPLVYLAGPYTHPDPVANTNFAIHVGLALWDTGLVGVIIPHLTLAAHLVSPRPLETWFAFDIDQLAHCDAVFRITGTSTGADREVVFAVDHEIPVFVHREQLLQWATTWTNERTPHG